MVFTIETLAKNNETNLLYDQTFRRLLEAYLPWLRTHATTQLIPIDPHHVYKFEGDFYGLLDAMGIHKSLHWLILRMNGLLRPGDVPQDLRMIRIPDPTLIDKTKQLYRRKKQRTLR